MEWPRFFSTSDESSVLRLSIAATLLIAVVGLLFGLVSGSFSIVFDGVYSLVDASMSALALAVVRLITSYAVNVDLPRKWRERFTMGFWHLEPMVLGLNGTLLVGVAVYALINGVTSLLSGGHELHFGAALVYAALTVSACVAMAVVESRANRRIRSDFVRLDIKSWIMSAGITAALLIAFSAGYAIQGTRWERLTPYVDPAALVLVCAAIIPIPLTEIRQALLDVLLVAPPDLKQHVDAVAAGFVERYAFQYYRAYVAKVGRSREIELYFVVPPDMPPKRIAEWDAIRDEIGRAIGGDEPHRWLTIMFTSDPQWAE
ncbi:cation diffusion facilitator family transporter [Paraburkholderia lycopersici]|uniref:Predicted Co/Zn/Cd cation transporter, cation efflux family n=1 Tax=Paraburkholderia lycopersici TaxID=416944 RepID=A0A1G7BSJ7_9BURK|nr:cation transporter [Paraburkholderia lycopersici]SDE29922.1 Predicted Co/Zn/Cd cation transporter, cation efflux family [Paraburkholderia lycopersici]